MKQSLHYSIVIGFLTLLTILFAYTILGGSNQTATTTGIPASDQQPTSGMIGIR
ncbi:MAG: hypothetical protein K0R82_3026 [Flavipsychrobacter sp.]|jgi:hypothetical protein|nr:hypothetical protein [Flavipsychrobacter sp.]